MGYKAKRDLVEFRGFENLPKITDLTQSHGKRFLPKFRMNRDYTASDRVPPNLGPVDRKRSTTSRTVTAPLRLCV